MLKKALIALLPITFLWEHLARMYSYWLKPSFFLNYISDVAERFFTFIGFIWAKLSSFLSWLDFEELFKSLQDLCIPLIALFLSPLRIVYGYITVSQQYENPFLIVIGSVIIISVVAYSINKYLPTHILNKLRIVSYCVMIYAALSSFLQIFTDSIFEYVDHTNILAEAFTNK